MGSKKYTRLNEKPKGFECANENCKWQGAEQEKAQKITAGVLLEKVCPPSGPGCA